VFAVAAELLAHAIDRDHSDGAQSYLACTCGQPARYAGRKHKRFVSVLGVLELERANYHCAICQRGFFPRDRSLGFCTRAAVVRGSQRIKCLRARMAVVSVLSVVYEHSRCELKSQSTVPGGTKSNDSTDYRSYARRRSQWLSGSG
jgi:hypothetical protein